MPAQLEHRGQLAALEQRLGDKLMSLCEAVMNGPARARPTRPTLPPRDFMRAVISLRAISADKDVPELQARVMGTPDFFRFR